MFDTVLNRAYYKNRCLVCKVYSSNILYNQVWWHIPLGRRRRAYVSAKKISKSDNI